MFCVEIKLNFMLGEKVVKSIAKWADESIRSFFVLRLYRYWKVYLSQGTSNRKIWSDVKYTVLTERIRSSSWKSTVFRLKLYGFNKYTVPGNWKYTVLKKKLTVFHWKLYGLRKYTVLLNFRTYYWPVAIELKSF